MHSARALWAIGIPYVLAYIAPTYLDEQITSYAEAHGASQVQKIGNVVGSPNVLLVSEPKETGPQGYEALLREEHESVMDYPSVAAIASQEDITDFVVFPGGFDLQGTLQLLQVSNGAVHADINFAPENIDELSALGRGFASIIMSTSSNTFLRVYDGDVRRLRGKILGTYSSTLLLKENRGGSRLFRATDPSNPIHATADLRPVQHSVGVGDCFNVAYIATRYSVPEQAALAYASLVAAEYASTTRPDTFRQAAQATLQIPATEVKQLRGVSLPWEARPDYNIYVAGPDFDYVDTFPIDRVAESLRYHNFTPRLPVRENGQVSGDAAPSEKERLCRADLAMLCECQMLLAVLLSDDPGTLIEVGIAVERRLPVVVYDPYARAKNLMLTQLPSLVSGDLDEIINEVFRRASEELRRGVRV